MRFHNAYFCIANGMAILRLVLGVISKDHQNYILNEELLAKANFKSKILSIQIF